MKRNIVNNLYVNSMERKKKNEKEKISTKEVNEGEKEIQIRKDKQQSQNKLLKKYPNKCK